MRPQDKLIGKRHTRSASVRVSHGQAQMQQKNSPETNISFDTSASVSVSVSGTFDDQHFSLTVHNIIDAEFEFRDGLILRHKDTFDLWRWTRQALGATGVLLGWTPMVQNKVRAQGGGGLIKFIAEHPEYQTNADNTATADANTDTQPSTAEAKTETTEPETETATTEQTDGDNGN